jgi:hypothetical protein
MHTKTRELTVETWVEYFAAFASGSEARSAAVEVVDGRAGDRPSVAPWPLQAIGYDPAEAVLEVTLGGRAGRDHAVLRHLISEPRTICVELESLDPTAIIVKDASGTRTRIGIFEHRRGARQEGSGAGRARRAGRGDDCGISPTTYREVADDQPERAT